VSEQGPDALAGTLLNGFGFIPESRAVGFSHGFRIIAFFCSAPGRARSAVSAP